MKIESFTISNYRAIVGPLTINIARNTLLPIIGVNECGKTTILHAILSFDWYNDDLNHRGRHLQDVDNLYSPAPDPPIVSASIKATRTELRSALRELKQDEDWEGNTLVDQYIRARPPYNNQITVARNLRDNQYTLTGVTAFADDDLNNALARQIVAHLPYILYFDDFQDSVPDAIEIPPAGSELSGWLATVDRLFKSTNVNYSVFDLVNKGERQRKSLLSDVNRTLNRALTDEWQNFRLDDADALRIAIDYEERAVGPDVRPHLKFDVVETDDSGREHFFFVRDRSKGFYWFFNFVMKLEFNPKLVDSEDVDAIYVLDEPGSYLHALAQERLCLKLRNLAQRNHVIYCTHSHHLLNPDVIPFSAIRVARKDGDGHVELVPIHEYRHTDHATRAAYQPVIDALSVKPWVVDLDPGSTVLIVEGMIDHFLIRMLRADHNIVTIPSVGASSIQYYISLMIGWGIDYRAVWDDDKEGRDCRLKALRAFGEREASERFLLLPSRGSKDTIIQHFLSGADVQMLKKKLQLPANASFDRVVTVWYYSEMRETLVAALSKATIEAFRQLFEKIDAKPDAA